MSISALRAGLVMVLLLPASMRAADAAARIARCAWRKAARACDFSTEADFRAKVKATDFSLTASTLDYTGIYGNRFHMLLDRDDGSTIDGEPYVKKTDWSIRSPFVRMPWCGDMAEVAFGGETLRLDFR
jgi:hypothetical protein